MKICKIIDGCIVFPAGAEDLRIHAALRFRYGEMSEHQKRCLHEAEILLAAAGVSFGTGSDVVDDKPINREWLLDWELKGATLHPVDSRNKLN